MKLLMFAKLKNKSSLQFQHAWRRWVLRRIGLAPSRVTNALQYSSPQSNYIKEPKEVISVSNGKLDPVSGYVFREDGTLEIGSTSWSSEKAMLRFPYQGNPRGKKLPGTSIFLGNQISYYHWLLEDLPASLRALRFSKEQSGMWPKLLIPDPAPRYVSSTVELLGIESMKISKVTSVDSLELVSKPPAMQPQRWAVKELENFARQHAVEDKDAQTKFYISRRHESLRRPKNEERVEEIFLKYKFRVVSLAGLSLQAQLNLFLNASFVAGSHGAGLSNIAFSSNLQNVFELKLDYQPTCFEQLANLKNAGYRTLSHKDRDNWEIDLVELERVLLETL